MESRVITSTAAAALRGKTAQQTPPNTSCRTFHLATAADSGLCRETVACATAAAEGDTAASPGKHLTARSKGHERQVDSKEMRAHPSFECLRGASREDGGLSSQSAAPFAAQSVTRRELNRSSPPL